ncbi:MAG: alpha-amylase family protein [Clostridia bacterium]|jgi:amylosucrase
MMDRSWVVFEKQCREAWRTRGLESAPGWSEFSQRLDCEFRRLAELLWDLYGGRPDYAFQVEKLVAEAFEAFSQRDERLRARDRAQPPESGWFLSETQVGAVAYVALFAGSLNGIVNRIPYLKELGISYLHLMPFFQSPEAHNDGGYAVSSYRDTNPALGSMSDLEALASALDKNNIMLVADFVFNHTSDEHVWARAAKAGDPDFQDFYLSFTDHAQALAYQARLRDIFPEARKGSFTWCPEMGRWVWTTFNSYQWDLNYRNPAVFRAMAAEMMSLANRGIGALRLDAVAFIWKELGTACENLPQAHTIIKAFQSVARLACPSLLFKSEAIVHPDEIVKYIDPRECQLSYNPLLMAELWEASATKDTRLLALSLRKRHRLPPGCTWVNYVRCHDDIGWTFADEDAAELGIKGGDHRAFLNDFYLGTFPGSFSRGVSFQFNPDTGDRRICGTAASLAGVEGAVLEGAGEDLDTAIRRVLLLYGIAFSAGGIPLIYLGDETGVLNQYDYESDPAKASDSRWVHRPAWSEELYRKRKDASSAPGRIFSGLVRISAQRRSNPVFGTQALTVMDTGQPGVLAFHKQGNGQLLTVLANFADRPITIDTETAGNLLAQRQGKDLLSDRLLLPGEPIQLEPCELLWVLLPAEP